VDWRWDFEWVIACAKLKIVADEIEMTCTTLLHKIWPNMREGPTTVSHSCLAVMVKLTVQTIMSHLVSNSTLAQVSNRYQLIDKLQLPSHTAMVVKAGEKSKANVFESYIAGVFQSYLQGPTSNLNGSGDVKPVMRTEGQAYDHIAEWLVPLFDPIARFIQQSLHDEQHRLSASSADQGEEQEVDIKQATGASALLNQHCIGVLGTGMPVYEHESTEGMLWRTKCTATLPGGEEV
jgi:ribonuclease-3